MSQILDTATGKFVYRGERTDGQFDLNDFLLFTKDATVVEIAERWVSGSMVPRNDFAAVADGKPAGRLDDEQVAQWIAWGRIKVFTQRADAEAAARMLLDKQTLMKLRDNIASFENQLDRAGSDSDYAYIYTHLAALHTQVAELLGEEVN